MGISEMYALWKKMQVYFDTSTLNESVKYIVHFWLTHGDWWGFFVFFVFFLKIYLLID